MNAEQIKERRQKLKKLIKNKSYKIGLFCFFTFIVAFKSSGAHQKDLPVYYKKNVRAYNAKVKTFKLTEKEAYKKVKVFFKKRAGYYEIFKKTSKIRKAKNLSAEEKEIRCQEIRLFFFEENLEIRSY